MRLHILHLPYPYQKRPGLEPDPAKVQANTSFESSKSGEVFIKNFARPFNSKQTFEKTDSQRHDLAVEVSMKNHSSRSRTKFYKL